MNVTRYNKAIAAAVVPVAIVVSAYLGTGHISQEQINVAVIALMGVAVVVFAPKNADAPPKT